MKTKKFFKQKNYLGNIERKVQKLVYKIEYKGNFLKKVKKGNWKGKWIEETLKMLLNREAIDLWPTER